MKFLFQIKETNWKYLFFLVAISFLAGSGIIFSYKKTINQFSLNILPLKKVNSWTNFKIDSWRLEISYPRDWQESIGGCATSLWGVSRDCLKIEYKKRKDCALYIAKIDETQYQDLLANGERMGKEEVKIGNGKGIKIKDCCGNDMPYLVRNKNGNFVINIVRPNRSSHQSTGQNSTSPFCPDIFQKIIDSINFK